MPAFPGLSARLRPFFALLVVLGVLLGAAAQTAPQTEQTPAQPRPPHAAEPEQHPTPPTSVTDNEASKPITKAEAKALFRSVDEILDFVSHDTGLPVKHKVKRKLITRKQVERYVAKNLENDQNAQRLEREKLVLVKFGMIPPDYDLHAEFLKLMQEQVAAFYDPKTKTVNLLDWVQPELQRPVLAHELTHALQDQTVGLSKWLRAGAKQRGQLPDEQEEVVEEAQAARENVSEGQAMLAMLDYTLAPSGLDVLKAPEIVDAMRASMTSGTDLPVIAAAPIYLRESIYMPYTFGLDFAREVLTRRGQQAAFLGALQRPPVDTLQIMRPEQYLDDKLVAPLATPELNALIGPDYERYDFGGIGAFDIYLITRQYDPKGNAKQYYPHWRGGYYLAAHDVHSPQNQIALVFVTQWDSPQAARDFAHMYRDYIPTRYPGASRLPDSCPVSKDEPECSGQEWETSSGRVLVEIQGQRLLVLEGFNQTVTQRARKELMQSRRN